MDLSQAYKFCLTVTCNALTANNELLEAQVTESNQVNQQLQDLTDRWTSALHENGSAASYTNVPAPFTAGENPYQALQTLIANPSPQNMQTYINTYIAPGANSGNTTDMSDFSSALVIQIIGALNSPSICDSGTNSQSPLQMNTLTAFLSSVNAEAANNETPYQVVSRNVLSAIQQNSGASNSIAQIGQNVNQFDRNSVQLLSQQY